MRTIHIALKQAPAPAWALILNNEDHTVISLGDAADSVQHAGATALVRALELVQIHEEVAVIFIHDQSLLTSYLARMLRWNSERTPTASNLDAGQWSEVRRLQGEIGHWTSVKTPSDEHSTFKERLSSILSLVRPGWPYTAVRAKGRSWEELLG